MTQDPKSNPNSYPSREAVEQRAHEIWEQRGSPDGQELDHWYQAEKELLEMRNKAEKASAASRPPAKPAPAVQPAQPAQAAPPAAKADPKKAAAPTSQKKK